jgi:cysteine desulfuration protein SufE
MSLAEKQVQLMAELAAIKNGQDRLACLVQKARAHPALASGQRVEANLLPGCLAKLWLVAEIRNGRCYFACDSDSLVVKAVGGLLCEFYSGHAPREILGHDPSFLAPLGINQHLTPNRRNALSRVWEHIRQFAENHVTGP